MRPIHNAVISLAIMLGTLAISAPAPAQTAGAMMERGDAARTGEMPGPGPVGNPVEVWRFTTESNVITSPIVADGVVYLGVTAGGYYALDARSGTVLWRYPGGFGPSVPAVAGGLVYVSSAATGDILDGNGFGNLAALNARTGAELWSVPVGMLFLSAPVVVDGVVYVSTYDKYLYALDAATGAVRWRFSDSSNEFFHGFFSVAVAGGVVYANGQDDLYAIDASTGKERWHKGLEGGGSRSLAVAHGTVYAGSGDGSVYALDVESGDERWRFAAGDVYGHSPAVVGEVVYIGSLDHNVYALDARSGVERWRFQTGGAAITSPSVADGTVYAGSDDGNIYALDIETGREKWRFATAGKPFTTPVVIGGVVFVNSGGTLYAIGGSESASSRMAYLEDLK